MREQMQRRLAELQGEFEEGQTKLRDLEMQAARLREALLRISGAIQVLQELQGGDQAAQGDRSAAAPATEGGERQ